MKSFTSIPLDGEYVWNHDNLNRTCCNRICYYWSRIGITFFSLGTKVRLSGLGWLNMENRKTYDPRKGICLTSLDPFVHESNIFIGSECNSNNNILFNSALVPKTRNAINALTFCFCFCSCSSLLTYNNTFYGWFRKRTHGGDGGSFDKEITSYFAHERGSWLSSTWRVWFQSQFSCTTLKFTHVSFPGNQILSRHIKSATPVLNSCACLLCKLCSLFILVSKLWAIWEDCLGWLRSWLCHGCIPSSFIDVSLRC